MGHLSCEELRAATVGCEVVLLVATDAEAVLLAQELEDARAFRVAGKKVLTGGLVRLVWPPIVPVGRRITRREPPAPRRPLGGGWPWP